MNIAFFGTPDFAVATLKKIVDEHYTIVGVFTAPDKPSGRGQQLTMSEVKKFALAANLPVYQPEKLKNPDFVAWYKKLNVDLAIVVAFRMMPEVIWSAPRIGTINLHGSMLPQYRGAAPINWAIMNGETETGVTTFFINNEIDKGEILFQETCSILPEDNFGTLYDKLKELGANLVLKTIKSIERGDYARIPQNLSSDDKLAPKIEKEVLELNNFHSCITLHNKIRGLLPVYKPYFVYNGIKFIVKNGYCELSNINEPIGSVWSNNKDFIKLVCGDGYYCISEIQMEGKKAIDTKSFLNGYKFNL
jgi:methionyl-tRNA formyltransferase